MNKKSYIFRFLRFHISNFRKILRVAKGKGVESVEQRVAKKYICRLWDLFRWKLLHREVLTDYYKYGFETKSHSEQDEYLSPSEMDQYREKITRILGLSLSEYNFSYLVVTADKYLANNYLNYLGIPCAENLGLINNESVVWREGKVESLESLLVGRNGAVFVKHISSSCGKGIFKIDYSKQMMFSEDGLLPVNQLLQIFKKGTWVVQKEVKQHHDLDLINPNVVNCLRINTVLNNFKPEYSTSFIKLATGKTVVDNWDKGSLLVGIDYTTGSMLSKGYYKIDGLDVCYFKTHPDTGMVLKGTVIPYFKEAVDLCLKAHQYYYGTFTIGWDVAITPDGPVIIEVNSTPLIFPLQLLFGGLRKRVEQLCSSYKNNK